MNFLDADSADRADFQLIHPLYPQNPRLKFSPYYTLFMHFHNLCRCHFYIPAVYLADYGSGQLQESASRHGIFIQSNRSTVVATFADALYDRNLSQ